MSVRAIEAQKTQAPVQISQAAAQGLSQGDIRRELVGKPLDDLAPKGTAERQMLGMLHQSLRNSTFGLSLKDLPIEVAQQILDSRADTMQNFFDSWSESIKHNADEDKKASQRRLLAQVLIKAVNVGAISQSQAEAYGAAAGIPNLQEGISANAGADRLLGMNRTRAPTTQDAMAPAPSLTLKLS